LAAVLGRPRVARFVRTREVEADAVAPTRASERPPKSERATILATPAASAVETPRTTMKIEPRDETEETSARPCRERIPWRSSPWVPRAAAAATPRPVLDDALEAGEDETEERNARGTAAVASCRESARIDTHYIRNTVKAKQI